MVAEVGFMLSVTKFFVPGFAMSGVTPTPFESNDVVLEGGKLFKMCGSNPIMHILTCRRCACLKVLVICVQCCCMCICQAYQQADMLLSLHDASLLRLEPSRCHHCRVSFQG